MTEQDLRALVREAIARHAAAPGGAAFPDHAGRIFPDPASVAPSSIRTHVSHAMFMVPAGADSDGPCLIEPAVACNHCGYCKSLGH